MPTVCCVLGCRVRTTDKGSHMFRFPKNPKLKDEWLSRIPGNGGKYQVIVKDSTRICSNHFQPSLIRERIEPTPSSNNYFIFLCVLYFYDKIHNNILGPTDSNDQTVKKYKKKWTLIKNAVPTVFPNAPRIKTHPVQQVSSQINLTKRPVDISLAPEVNFFISFNIFPF